MRNPPHSGRIPASGAGKIAVVLLLGVVAFQLALAAGAPWGAQGGMNEGVFPDALRIGSVITAVSYALLAATAGNPFASAGNIDVRRR